MWDLASIFVTALVPAILWGVAAGVTVALEAHEHRLRRGDPARTSTGRTRGASRRLVRPGGAG
jgi:hypothetical protein